MTDSTLRDSLRYEPSLKALACVLLMLLCGVVTAVLFRSYRFQEADAAIDLYVAKPSKLLVALDTGTGFGAAPTEEYPLARGENRISLSIDPHPFKKIRFDIRGESVRLNLKRAVFHGTSGTLTFEGAKLKAQLRKVITRENRVVGDLSVPGRVTRRSALLFWGVWALCIAASIAAVGFAYRTLQREAIKHRVLGTMRTFAESLSDPDLIVVDAKVMYVMLATLVLGFVLSLLQVHTSSVQVWNDVVPQRGTDSVLFGTPLAIRSDEWKEVPAELAYEPSFATLIHASRWGYFAGAGVGTAWLHNFWLLYPFLGAFALGLYLGGNRLGLALCGAGWITTAAHFQWWDGMGEVGDIALLLIGGLYFFYGIRRSHLLWGLGMVGAGAIGTVSYLYPPWQVPLINWALLMLAAPLLIGRLRARIRTLWSSKAALLTAGVVLSALAGYAIWQRVGPEIEVIAKTVYPGQRRSVSGGILPSVVFSGFYDAFLSIDRFPKYIGNVCEAASFSLLFPITGLMIAIRLVQRKAIPTESVLTLIHIGFLIWWMVGSVSPTFAAWTLMDRVPPGRAMGPLGVESVFASISALGAGVRLKTFSGRARFLWMFVLLGMALAGLWFHALELRLLSPDYYSERVLWVGMGTTALLILALYAESAVLLCAGIVLSNAPNLLIHPINQGFAPVADKEIVREVRRLHRADPKAKWIVFGSRVHAKLLAATGADVFNNRSYPDHAEMAFLDENGSQAWAWNRYSAFRGVHETVDTNVTFVSPSPDLWGVRISASSPRIARMGVRYVVFSSDPRLGSLGRLRQVLDRPVNGAWVFRTGAQTPSLSLLAGRTEAREVCGQVALGEKVAAVRAQLKNYERVSDVFAEQGGRFQRCLFGLPMAQRIVDIKAGLTQVGIRCAQNGSEDPLNVYVLLRDGRFVHLTPSSTCDPPQVIAQPATHQ